MFLLLQTRRRSAEIGFDSALRACATRADRSPRWIGEATIQLPTGASTGDASIADVTCEPSERNGAGIEDWCVTPEPFRAPSVQERTAGSPSRAASPRP